MRRIGYNKRAVSNVLAYLFSFTITSTVMIGTVFTATSIIDDTSNKVARLEAQSVANHVADALMEVIAVTQSMPGLDYNDVIDIPLDLAGKSYYIDITDTEVIVTTTDNAIKKSSTYYNAGGANLDISEKIYGGSGKIVTSYQPPDVVYKLDFGTSDSPVESGYCKVTGDVPYPVWYDVDWSFRVPIWIDPSVELNGGDIVEIVLSPTNFLYEEAYVTDLSGDQVFGTVTSVKSGLLFYDPSGAGLELEYCIDYWNPNGESIILVKMGRGFLVGDSWDVNTIYLYFGLEDTSQATNHLFDTFCSPPHFFDDFDIFDMLTWYRTTEAGISDPAEGILQINIVDENCQYICTIDDLLLGGSGLGEDLLYVVEMKYQNEESFLSDASMILLSQETADYMAGSYLVTSRYDLPQLIFSIEDIPKEKVSIPSHEGWQRMRSYIYVDEDLSESSIWGYLYDFETFLPYENSIYFTPANPDPKYINGKIGIGVSLLNDEFPNSKISVDWIRMLKLPTEQPTVTIGPLEIVKSEWHPDFLVPLDKVYALDRTPADGNPYYPGPLLRDFNYVDNDPPGYNNDFHLRTHGLGDGPYNVGVTCGDIESDHAGLEVWRLWKDLRFPDDYQRVLIIEIPAADAGVFQTVWSSYQLTYFDEIDDIFMFYFINKDNDHPAPINSMVLQESEGFNGIKIEAG